MLHFHLRRGGVTSVMFQQAACLALTPEPPRVIFVAGTGPETPSPVAVFVVPQLDYDVFTKTAPEGQFAGDRQAGAEALAARLETTLRTAFPEGCDLLHVHNPLLAKNRWLLGALALLQRRGQAILIQVHDVAEDFRPEVYESFWDYPQDCHYAMINRRDQNRFVAAGLAIDQVHLLPNPVSPAPGFEPRARFPEERAKGRPTVLYPVRGIRRKNLGEALLLSRFLPAGAEVAVTLPPTSPGDQQRYEDWKAAARTLNLPVRFEAGADRSLADLYNQSFCALTTSVKEGFGYAYLEPLIRGVPVVGRALPAVFDDFKAAGVSMEGLYDGLRIPLSSLAETALPSSVEASLNRLKAAFAPVFGGSQTPGWQTLEESLVRRFAGEETDFGALDETAQRTVLRRWQNDPGWAAEVEALNPVLKTLFDTPPSPSAAEADRNAILRSYGEQTCGTQLRAVYDSACHQKVGGRIDKAQLAALYLKPEAFFLVAS